MKFNFTDTLFALSFALDCVEHDLLGVTTNHSKRVATICICMGKQLQLTDAQLLDLAACSLLHDNALTEYIQTEYVSAQENTVLENEKVKIHCVKGERNVEKLPFLGNVKNAILYHHENADGTGPLGKCWQETPLYARIIHLADQVDARFDLSLMDSKKYDQLVRHLEAFRGTDFDDECLACFLKSFPYAVVSQLQNENLDRFLKDNLPGVNRTYTSEQILGFASVFAMIIDYKSTFTRLHSIEIAKKAKRLGQYYGFSEDHNAKLYLAGALHDIGKLVIDMSVLEKPDKLTDEEYRHIKQHAYQTHLILERIDGLEDVAAWASNHHEKLDGSGYPFGKHAEELCREDRMLACLDIYQALTEERPYRTAMSHLQAIGILRGLAAKGQLDAHIVDDIDRCFAPVENAS